MIWFLYLYLKIEEFINMDWVHLWFGESDNYQTPLPWHPKDAATKVSDSKLHTRILYWLGILYKNIDYIFAKKLDILFYNIIFKNQI